LVKRIIIFISITIVYLLTVNRFAHFTIALASTETPKHSFQICSPLERVEIDDLDCIISSPYDPPPMGKDDRHQGVDFSYHHWINTGSVHGVIVQSVFPGKVIASLEDTFPYGNLIIVETSYDLLPKEIRDSLIISTDHSLYLLYAHLDGRPWSALGQSVVPCQSLGLVGKSGNAIVPHLHFEARVGRSGATFTGLSRFTDEASDIEKENYILWRKSGRFIHFNPMDLFSFDEIEVKHFISKY